MNWITQIPISLTVTCIFLVICKRFVLMYVTSVKPIWKLGFSIFIFSPRNTENSVAGAHSELFLGDGDRFEK